MLPSIAGQIGRAPGYGQGVKSTKKLSSGFVYIEPDQAKYNMNQMLIFSRNHSLCPEEVIQNNGL